jgi:hypothetical protein
MSAFNSGAVVLTAINGKALDGSLKSYCDAVKGIGAGENATVSYVDVSDTFFATTQTATVKF